MKLDKPLLTFIRIFAVIWGFCIITVIILIGIATNGFGARIQDTEFGNSNLFTLSVISLISLGILSFASLTLVYIVTILIKESKSNSNNNLGRFLIFFFKLLFILAIFPVFLFNKVSGLTNLISNINNNGLKLSYLIPKSLKVLVGRLVAILIIITTILPIWIGGYVLAVVLVKQELGYNSDPIKISGTGSMYPTFPKGQGKTSQALSKEIVSTPGMLPYPNGLVLFGNRYFNYNLQRGDIIIFQNLVTEEITKKQYGEATGLAKRLIALPGDSIEIRGGLVYLNGKALKESYTAKPRSTFGEAFLSECTQLKIPPGKIFAMGDNRKGSSDSREIGLVDIEDINHVLPISSQKGVWDLNWRDTSKDFDESSKIKLDKNKYLELLNEKRKEAGVKPLIYQPKLEESALERGKVILKFDDFSWEATRSGYTMQKALADAGYSNITYGEAPTQGYFEADELIDNQFQFPSSKEFLLNKDNQEFGIAEIEGEINGCPTQIIVQHFAGYVPPNYKSEDIQSWGALIDNLNNLIPDWEKIKDWPNVNKDDLNKLLELMYKQKNNAEAIYYRMKANQWLTSDEEIMLKEEKSLNEQISALADKLNGK